MSENQRSKLLEKLNNTSGDSTFSKSLWNIFEEFSDEISKELKCINQLFEEYTPHDDIHMKSLLRITDQLLSNAIIDNLNEMEICILLCAIYGHDWGMAVSLDEKERIVTGKVPSGKTEEDFALLENEQQRWKSYADSCGIDVSADGYVENHKDISKEQWQEYVRQTHAGRARVRSIHYFRDKGDLEPLGIPIGEVCAGHWYDLAKIRKMETQWSVGGIIVNLRALATYMRFIDLLDIGNNRTPFALRKFINPRDSKSSIEWKKHQSINPVTISEADSVSGERKLHFHGSTDDYIVYAALEDLRRYCERQISENVIALKEMGKYNLGSIELDWNIIPIGFEPLNIRFEFNRNHMFDLISGEIYNGDPYVFIRELIQNAIDATMLRQKRYEKGCDAKLINHDLTISVEANHHENGDLSIVVTDCGTGMTIDIVRDYLATVGNSYYLSDEFRALKTDMKAISRFGVGLISCFEVADSIIIETETDKQFDTPERLNIVITDYSQQFRVQKKVISEKPGTKVSVEVKASKWKKGIFAEHKRLNITEYIKMIAGFVPYPILIVEDGAKTIVCSADASEMEKTEIGKNLSDATLWQLRLDFGLDEVFEPQHVDVADSILNAHTLQIFSEDVDVHIKGALAYFLPSDNLICSVGDSGLGYKATFFYGNQSNYDERKLRLLDGSSPPESEKISPSATRSLISRVYFRGILIPEAKIMVPGGSGSTPSRITINIDCDRDELIPVLSRRDLKMPLCSISNSILKQFQAHIKQKFKNQFYTEKLKDRLVLLGRLSEYTCSTSVLSDIFEIDEWPAIVLDKKGLLSIDKIANLPDEIEIAPECFLKQKDVLNSVSFDHILEKKIIGAEGLVSEKKPMMIQNFGFEYSNGFPREWHAMDQCLSFALNHKYKLDYIRIGKSDETNLPYIVKNKIRGESCDTTIHKKEVLLHDNFEFTEFSSQNSDIVCVLRLEFKPIYENSIYRMIFNTKHIAVGILKKVINASNNGINELSPKDAGKIKDAFRQLPFVGNMCKYKPNYYEPLVASWLPMFCFAVADTGIVNLTEEERKVLRNPIKVIVCRV